MVKARLAKISGVIGLVLWAAAAGCQMTSYGKGAVAPGTLVLNRHVPIETEHNQLVHVRKEVKDTDYDFRVLFGPYPPGERATGKGQFNNPDPEWFTYQGYSFAWGWWPVLTTARVKAITEGTTVVVQVGPSFDRVFLVNPGRDTSVRVEDAGNPNNFRTLTSESYVQASGSAGSITFTEPAPIPASGEICEFIAYVIELAQSAGYDGPDHTCGPAGN